MKKIIFISNSWYDKLKEPNRFLVFLLITFLPLLVSLILLYIKNIFYPLIIWIIIVFSWRLYYLLKKNKNGKLS